MQGKCLLPNWPAPRNVFAFTTLRNTELKDIILPAEPVLMQQVHGTAVICMDKLTMDMPQQQADAAIAFTANKVCAVRTADCLPVFLCDKQGSQVAVIHAGWRGLAAGIIAETCKEFTAPLQQCLVWLGPAIGPTSFEVGNDVVDNFKSHGWQDKHLELGFKPRSKDKLLGDLYCLARIALEQAGILGHNIYGGEYCTYSDTERFYSYRRSNDAGRMLNLIWFAD